MRFRLLAQDMMEHSSAAAVTVSNTADTELIAYFADCKTYSENSGLKFWVTNTNKYPLLAPLAQDLLSAPASEAYVERVLNLWRADSIRTSALCSSVSPRRVNWLR